MMGLFQRFLRFQASRVAEFRGTPRREEFTAFAERTDFNGLAHFEKLTEEEGSKPLSDSFLHRQMGRIKFLLSLALIAVLGGAALRLWRPHASSPRATMLLEYCLALLGVFWIRSLERRLRDAGLPRWCFWPYFLIAFTACFAVHALRYANLPRTIELFFLLQLPAILFQSAPAPAGLLSESANAAAAQKSKPSRPVTPLGAFEFAIYLLLIAGLWQVLHLLRSDMSIMPHARVWKLSLNAASVLLCLAWFFSVRGRLRSLGRTRWTFAFCAFVLAVCLLPLAFRLIGFPLAIVLFVALQIPVVFLRRGALSARFFPVDRDS
jgi:hypothetical protein